MDTVKISDIPAIVPVKKSSAVNKDKPRKQFEEILEQARRENTNKE